MTNNSVAMVVFEVFHSTGGSLLKTRRALLRRFRWSDADWHRWWPVVGEALEVACESRRASCHVAR